MELFKRSMIAAAALCAGVALSACETPGDREAPEPAGRSPAGDPGRALPPGGSEGYGGTGTDSETAPAQ